MRLPVALIASATLLACLSAPACSRAVPSAAAPALQQAAAPETTTQADTASSRYVLTTPEFNGVAIHELSGLAWDADEKLLYAVSDQGFLYHFKLTLEGDTLVSVVPVFAAKLRDPSGAKTPAKGFNAEGLSLTNADNAKPGDTELVVSLEGSPGPQILRFGTDGNLLGALDVPAPANAANLYVKKGRGLESVGLSATHGLMTAPESPLIGQPQDRHTLFANGGHWSFVRQTPDSRLKAFDLLPDGNALVLERSRAGSKTELVASVRRVALANCTGETACATTTLAEFPKGPENFEGMALLDPHHLLLVSDDGGLATPATTFLLMRLP